MTERGVAPEGEWPVVLGIRFEETRGVLLSQAKTEVAVLNKDIFTHLSSIQHIKSLEVQALMSMQSLRSLTSRLGYIEKGTVAKVNLNIYGDHEASDSVAVDLSHNDLFLQEPDRMVNGSTYDNPQSLRLPEHIKPYVNEESRLEVSHHSQDGQATPLALVTDDNNDLDFDKLLDRFANHDHLVQATVDGRIRTLLLESVNARL